MDRLPGCHGIPVFLRRNRRETVIHKAGQTGESFSGNRSAVLVDAKKRVVQLSILLLVVLLLLMPSSEAWPVFSHGERTAIGSPEPLESDDPLQESYDVIVAGTDPEGVVAAVSAARNGLSVLLTDKRETRMLGGLLTLGWLNSLDLNKSPNISWRHPLPYLNKGIFHEWVQQMGGTSFDVNRAAHVFHSMVLDEPNIDLLLGVRSMAPVVEDGVVRGMQFVRTDGESLSILAGAVIDATQDGDIAAMAGVPHTYGREDLGDPDVNMAVTLVFKLDGVTDAVWRQMRRYPGVGSDERSIWGYGEARQYPSSVPERVKMRSLNIGRQEDGTALVNSMQIYDVNPLDPASVADGLRVGREEAPKIVAWLQQTFEPFRHVTFGGTAPELYVRESRHMQAEYMLTVRDLMENRDHWDAIAYGAYEVDIQSTDSHNYGHVLLKPQQYGVPFRSLVPLDIDGLLVVGRAAGFSSLAHGSARVVPLGMATGEAAGAAAALAKERGLTFRALSRSEEDIAELRKRLVKQGMKLNMVDFEPPEYLSHPHYEGLLTAVSLLMTSGGYTNDAWQLDGPANPRRLFNMIQRLHKMYPNAFPNRTASRTHVAEPPLSLEEAAEMLLHAAGQDAATGGALKLALERGWISQACVELVQDEARLTNGELFSIVRDMLGNYADVWIK